MSNTAASNLPLSSQEGEAPAGNQEPVRWEVVARMPGLTNASIIAGRLKAEGIPVRIWQEGAGQALGLTVGLLGTGYVEVPERFADQALEILAAANDGELEDLEEMWEDADAEDSE